MYFLPQSQMENSLSKELEETLKKVLDLPEMYIVSPLTETFKNQIRDLLKRCADERSKEPLEKAA